MCTLRSEILPASSPCRFDVTAWVLETFLDSRRSRSSMFLKSMLPPTLSWYVRSRTTPVLEQLGHDPVGDRGADLALDVVAHDRHTGGLELRRPLGVGGDEDREGVDERDLGVDGALCV